MSAIPGNLTRIPNLLQAQVALANITRTQLDLFQVQNEISSGTAISRFSDDPARAAAIAILNDRPVVSGIVKSPVSEAEVRVGLTNIEGDAQAE